MAIEANGHHPAGAALGPGFYAALPQGFAPVPGGPANAAPDAGAVTVGNLLAAVRRRWILALSLGLTLGGGAAAAGWHFAPAPYSAASQLRISSVRERVIFQTSEQEAGFGTYKQSQMMLVKSPFVLAAALRKPEVANLPMVRNSERPTDVIESSIYVSSPAEEFLQISMSGDDPAAVATIVNGVTDAYIDEVVNNENGKRKKRKAELERILRLREESLRTKRNAQQRLAEALSTGDSEALSLKQQMAEEYFAQIRREHATVRFELLRANNQLALAEGPDAAAPAKVDDVPAAVIDQAVRQDPRIQKLDARAEQLRSLIARTRERVSRDDNPTLVGYTQELAKLDPDRRRIAAEIRPEVASSLKRQLTEASESTLAQLRQNVALLEIQEGQLREELESIELKNKRLGTSSFELETLRKESEQIERVSDTLQSEIARLDVELDAPDRISLYKKAERPTAPDMKRKSKFATMAGGGVFGLVIAGIVWLDYRTRKISSLSDVVDGIHLRVLGSLPILPRSASGGSANGRARLMQGIWTESVDSTRTMILRDAAQGERRVLMICSALGGEGKSTLATHLATSLARSGRNTLIVDTDLRRPAIHKVFDVPAGPGFCELLRGEAEIDDAVRPGATDSLSILPAGRLNQAALKSLAAGVAGGVFQQLRDRYDFIIVDSAPLLPVNDSLLVAQHVDAALFAIRRDVSRYTKVTAAQEKLGKLGVPVMGAVVTGIDESGHGFRYGYGSYYSSRYAYYAVPVAAK